MRPPPSDPAASITRTSKGRGQFGYDCATAVANAAPM